MVQRAVLIVAIECVFLTARAVLLSMRASQDFGCAENCGWASKTWLLSYACCGLHFIDSAACVPFDHSTPLQLYKNKTKTKTALRIAKNRIAKHKAKEQALAEKAKQWMDPSSANWWEQKGKAKTKQNKKHTQKTPVSRTEREKGAIWCPREKRTEKKEATRRERSHKKPEKEENEIKEEQVETERPKNKPLQKLSEVKGTLKVINRQNN